MTLKVTYNADCLGTAARAAYDILEVVQLRLRQGSAFGWREERVHNLLHHLLNHAWQQLRQRGARTEECRTGVDLDQVHLRGRVPDWC